MDKTLDLGVIGTQELIAIAQIDGPAPMRPLFDVGVIALLDIGTHGPCQFLDFVWRASCRLERFMQSAQAGRALKHEQVGLPGLYGEKDAFEALRQQGLGLLQRDGIIGGERAAFGSRQAEILAVALGQAAAFSKDADGVGAAVDVVGTKLHAWNGIELPAQATQYFARCNAPPVFGKKRQTIFQFFPHAGLGIQPNFTLVLTLFDDPGFDLCAFFRIRDHCSDVIELVTKVHIAVDVSAWHEIDSAELGMAIGPHLVTHGDFWLHDCLKKQPI
ncbi:MAG: hypothetical protein ACRYF5_03310 [Janthinobacterium lividum]